MEFTASNTETCTMAMIRCPVDPGPTFPTIAQALSFQSVTTSAHTRPGMMNAPTSVQPATTHLSDLFIIRPLLELDRSRSATLSVCRLERKYGTWVATHF